jgi:hypothetical protein
VRLTGILSTGALDGDELLPAPRAHPETGLPLNGRKYGTTLTPTGLYSPVHQVTAATLRMAALLFGSPWPPFSLCTCARARLVSCLLVVSGCPLTLCVVVALACLSFFLNF